MTSEDKVYLTNMMKDVKGTAARLTDNGIDIDIDKVELNFYRIADVIIKMLSDD